MLVFLTVIIVNVCGGHALAHDIETHLYALVDMGVSCVETKAQVVQVGIGDEMLQRGGRAEFARCVFQRDGYAARLGKNAKMFERAESRVELARICGLASVADVLHQETKGNSLRHFDCPLQLVDSVEAPYALCIGNRNGYAAFAPGRKVALGG